MPHSLKLGLTVATLAALGLSAAHPAAAQPTIYNFQSGSTGVAQTYTGTGVLGNGGKSTSIFNREVYQNDGATNIAGGTQSTIQDSNGGANSALTFTYQAAQFFATTAAPPTDSAQTLLQSVSFDSSYRIMSLTGLAANTPFTVYFYGEGTNEGGYGSVYNLANSNYAHFTYTGTVNSNNATVFTNNPGNYLFTTGTTDANGGIYATYSGNFNGAQFQVGNPVPEAMSSISLGILLGLGGITLFVRKRIATSKNAA